MQERILDIGIGDGGNYITNDGNDVLRIGMDNYEYLCEIDNAKKKYRVPLVKGDVKDNLPFADQSFQKVDILFPLDDLLYNLCFSEVLWHELGRVMDGSGKIRIITELPQVGLFGLSHNGTDIVLNDHPTVILHTARTCGFKTERIRLTPDEIKLLGTQYSESRASKNYPGQVFQITACR